VENHANSELHVRNNLEIITKKQNLIEKTTEKFTESFNTAIEEMNSAKDKSADDSASNINESIGGATKTATAEAKATAPAEAEAKATAPALAEAEAEATAPPGNNDTKSNDKAKGSDCIYRKNDKQKSGKALKDSFDNVTISKKIIDRIKEKLVELYESLKEISPAANKKNSWSVSVSTFSNRFFDVDKQKEKIFTNLSIVNGMFIFYNSQFDWIVKEYERLLTEYNKGDLLNATWINIKCSDDYKNYLKQELTEVNDAQDVEAAKQFEKLENAAAAAKKKTESDEKTKTTEAAEPITSATGSATNTKPVGGSVLKTRFKTTRKNRQKRRISQKYRL
jgi:hypothetical protein